MPKRAFACTYVLAWWVGFAFGGVVAYCREWLVNKAPLNFVLSLCMPLGLTAVHLTKSQRGRDI
jgi:hypothetical protein